ncbi:MAG TPA: NUDIX domain-containing protein [Rhodopseudomonas sp.]|uniref:NUDIX hydrolase n=1 Tax=Rhodopseudomonas sp. TaxID=1078 RepID=UPI002EDB5495
MAAPAELDAPPYRPQLAVSAAIFRDGRLLVVRRARAPAKGWFSLPGGKVEYSESLAAALHREVAEETALSIEIAALAGWHEVLPGPQHAGHYLIMSFAARWIGGEPRLNEELDDFRWIAPDAVAGLRHTEGLPAIAAAASALLRR